MKYVIALLLVGIWLSMSVLHDDIGRIEMLIRVIERKSDERNNTR